MQPTKLISKTFLNEQVIELKLKTQKTITQPGQWFFIHYLDSKTPLKRAYSIADVEQEREFSIFTFLIKLVPGGKGSELLKKAHEDSAFGLEGPNGHFILRNTENPKVFLATGSGLAPCYRMAKAERFGAKKWFFFSVSYEKDLFYTQEIKTLGIPETHISISRELVKGFEFGRIDIEKFNFPKDTEFYICGVPTMVKAFLAKLRGKGYTQIFVESY